MATGATAHVLAIRVPALAFPGVSVMALLASIPAAIILGLLAVVVWISVRVDVVSPGYTLEHYASLYTDPLAYGAFLNTLGFALTTGAVALAIGIPAAWLAERTDLGGKSVLYTTMTLGLLIPGFFTAMGWLFLLHPRIGMVNQAAMGLFGLSQPPFSIISIPGMGWVQGLSLASLVFIMTSASLRAMDASLEESAQTSGAGFVTTLRRITLPLAFPSILATGLYVFTIGISAFDVPLIIGLSNRIVTFSTYLYLQTNPFEGVPRYGITAAFSTFMLALALLLSWWYSRVLVQARKYQVITGKGYRPRLTRLGRWAIAAWLFLGGYILLSKVMPLLLLVWAATLPFLQPPSLNALQTLSLQNFTTLPWPLLTRGLSHTLVLMVGAPTLALLCSLVISWVVLRSRSRFRLAFDYIAFLPHAVPSVVFGLGALMSALFVIRGPFDLHGSLFLLLLMYALVQISFATRVVNGGLIQIHTELEEAAYISGARTPTVLRRIVIPLLKPAFVNAWLWLALLAFRELTLATVLFSPENVTLSFVAWSLWNSGRFGHASAVTLLMMAVLVPLILVYWRLARGARERGVV